MLKHLAIHGEGGLLSLIEGGVATGFTHPVDSGRALKELLHRLVEHTGLQEPDPVAHSPSAAEFLEVELHRLRAEQAPEAVGVSAESEIAEDIISNDDSAADEASVEDATPAVDEGLDD